MFDKLRTEEQRYEELMARLGTSEVQADPAEYRKHAKALAEVEPLVEKYREYKSVAADITGAEELAASADADMRELAKEELKALTVRRDALVAELKVLLIPAATERRCSPASCSGCTASSPSATAGASR